MKKLHNIHLLKITLVSLVCAMMSCQKDMMSYEGVEGVYFAVQYGPSYGSEKTWAYQPNTSWEFVKVPDTESTIKIKVMITGPVKAYDRIFKVEVNPDSSTAVLGTHYKALPENLVIPAHAVSTFVPVTLLRSPDLKHTEKVLGLRLVKNESFELSFPNWDAIPSFSASSSPVIKKFDASLHQIKINDFVVKPEVWIGSLQPGNRESGAWGVFSQKKIELMYQIMDLRYEDFANLQVMPGVRSSILTNLCAEYLIARYNAGDPVLEEDGRLMYIGAVPWTSYLGVPWVKN